MRLAPRGFPGFRFSTVREAFRVFRPALRGLAPDVVRAVVLSLLVAGLELLKPWPIKVVFDQVLEPGRARAWGLSPGGLLGAAAGAILLISLVLGALSVRAAVASARVGRKITVRVRRQVYSHLHRLALPFHQSRRTGELLTRVTSDVNKVRDLLLDTWVSVVERGTMIVGMAAVLLVLDPILALLAILPLPFVALRLSRSSKALKKQVRKQRRKEGTLAAFAAETLRQIEVVKAYAAEDRATERFAGESRSSERAGMRAVRIAAGMGRLTEIASGVGLALLLLAGAWRVQSGHLTPGGLIVIVSYARSLYKPLRKLSTQGGRLSKAAVSGERLMEVLRTPPETAGQGRPAPAFRGSVVFEDVRYAYPGGMEALRGLSFRVAPGTLAAMTGENGSGKSTALAVLLRLVNPDAGRVLVDGEPIDAFELDSYRRRFAYVPQDVLLFGATIRENILYGRPDAADGEAEEAARVALLHERVMTLPEGYNTVLGEGGGTLSGGEARRLMLARAALRDARILLLDEPLAGLDPVARPMVARAIRQIAAGRTTMVVNHGSADELQPDLVLQVRGGCLDGQARRVTQGTIPGNRGSPSRPT